MKPDRGGMAAKQLRCTVTVVRPRNDSCHTSTKSTSVATRVRWTGSLKTERARPIRTIVNFLRSVRGTMPNSLVRNGESKSLSTSSVTWSVTGYTTVRTRRNSTRKSGSPVRGAAMRRKWYSRYRVNPRSYRLFRRTREHG